MEKELYIKPGDHLILRKYSPSETIGGGVVIQLCDKVRREKVCQKPEESGETMKKICALYQQAGFFPPKTCEVKKQLGKEPGFPGAFFKMIQQGDLCRFGEGDYMAKAFYKKGKECAAFLFRQHGEIPYRNVQGYTWYFKKVCHYSFGKLRQRAFYQLEWKEKNPGTQHWITEKL